MTEVLLQTLLGATFGLVIVLALRRSARRVFGAGPAFTLWLLPVALAFAPLLPQELAPVSMVVLPGVNVTPNLGAASSSLAVGIDWAKCLMVLWLGGAAAGLLRLGMHYVR